MAEMSSRSKLSAGTTVAESRWQFDANDFKVKFQIIVENHANDVNLQIHQTKLTAGCISVLAKDIVAKHSQAIMGHKTPVTATGCCGTITWKICGTNKMLAIMYSLPFDFHFHSNWIGLGIFDTMRDTTPLFREMYYNQRNRQFDRKDFRKDVDPLVYENDSFAVRATCGNTHAPTIHVDFHKKEPKKW